MKNVCKRLMKNFTKICDQSNYYNIIRTSQQVIDFTVCVTRQIKINENHFAEASCKSVSRLIFAYSYFSSDKVLIKNEQKIIKR